MNNLKRIRPLKIVFFLLVILLVVFNFSGPLYPGSDFWWHIGTGKWIFQNSSIPSTDPFSFNFVSTDSLREKLILKGYWLSQLSYYVVYICSGFYGIVLYKSFIFLSISFVSYCFVCKKTSNKTVALFSILPIIIFSIDFVELRPQVFSFLFFLILLRFLSDLEKKEKSYSVKMVKIIVLMMIWSNMHPGFVIGILILLIYLAFYLCDLFSKNSQYEEKNIFIICAGIFSTQINPVFFGSVKFFLFFDKFAVNNATEFVSEYKNIYDYLSMNHPVYLFVWILFALICTLAVFVNINNYKRETVFIYLLLMIMGVYSYRYSYFYSISAIPLLLDTKRKVNFSFVNKNVLLIIFSMIFVASIFLNYATQRETFIETAKVGPVKIGQFNEAARFAKQVTLPQPTFFPYEWGGNVIWDLFPAYRTFVDPRTLDLQRYSDYRAAKGGDFEAIFDKYGINSVVFGLVEPLTPRVFPDILVRLFRSEKWSIAYYQGGSVVAFVRNSTGYRGEVLDKKYFLEKLVLVFMREAKLNPSNPANYASLGKIYFMMGEVKTSKEYFLKALSLDNSIFYRQWYDFVSQLN